MSNILVIYHGGNCPDGFCSAWIAHKVFPDAEFFPANYNEPPPDVEGKDVYILDFSYPRDVLLDMKDKAASLVVIDHHTSAQKNLKGLDFCHFDMEHSGAYLTWVYFWRQGVLHDQIPDIVLYVEDRDLWNWNEPQSREISAALASHPQDFHTWDTLAGMMESGGNIHGTFQNLVSEGEAILRYQQQQVDIAVKRAKDAVLTAVTLKGEELCFEHYIVPMVNSTTLISEIAGTLAQDRPFGVCWFRQEDGRFQYSLRSDINGVDVSEVAKTFGGGGHRHAAGFVLDYLIPNK